ncbi:cytochrome P450 family protein [Streptomyces antibioticus]|uniref:cytochrome P450 family protein n=1 Tax=Streptomyces antibioticus TaxID=1890 RepID=UPI00224D181A|nr:cytochrome P450 [Streptomyces antibioticus]MCX4741089.1 cytochrome P450 [Streptomyces antibioticus]
MMDPDLLADPFTGYGRLRERGPVVRGRFVDGTPVWFVTRYDDVRAVLRDPRFVNTPSHVPGEGGADPREGMMDLLDVPEHLRVYLLGSILDSDPPDHPRLRRLVTRAFAARRILGLRPGIERIADRLLAELPRREEEDGTVDLLEHFAYPLSITVICELVGIPATDLERWREWGGDLVSMRPERLRHSFPVMIDYCHRLIEQRRAALTDDLLSELIRAQDDDGGRLSDIETVTMILTLVLAGHETSAHLIGNGTAALLTHPGQWALLRKDPALLPRAVHELMRWCGSVHVARLRYATEDLELAGTPVARGDAVQLVLVSANFDPRHYSDPDRLDITRHQDGQAENHVGFGHGIHYCLGATLARQEGEVALARLLETYPDLALADGDPEVRRARLPGSWRLDALRLRLRP